MTGYEFTTPTEPNVLVEDIYASVVKNGNKLTFVLAMFVTKLESAVGSISFGAFKVPSAVSAKLYPFSLGGVPILAHGNVNASTSYYQAGINLPYWLQKGGQNVFFGANTAQLETNVKYYIRFEQTFTLSDNLAQ